MKATLYVTLVAGMLLYGCANGQIRAPVQSNGAVDCAAFGGLCGSICAAEPCSMCTGVCEVLGARCEAIDDTDTDDCDVDVTWRNVNSTTWTADFTVVPASGTVERVTWEILGGPTAGTWPMSMVHNNRWQGEPGAVTMAGTDVRLRALVGGQSVSTEVFDYLNNDTPKTAGCEGDCTPATCESLGVSCGTADDGCGGELDCGECDDCVPNTDAEFCAQQGADCGQVVGTDNCGATRTVASCGTCTAPETCGAGRPNRCGQAVEGLFLDGFFPIGVFSARASDFPMWVSRGVNTVIGAPSGPWHSDTDFDQAAKDLGLMQIRKPLGGDPSADVNNPSLLAWFQKDEPDAHGGPQENRDEARANYARWKAVDRSIPVVVNFGGSDVLNTRDGCNGPGDGGDEACYPLFINAADWISNDIYPLTGYLFDNSTRGQITLVGDVVDKLSRWTDKPQFNFIETCNQRFSSHASRGPTRHEVRAEIWNGIIHGSRGYFFFSIAFNPFQWDNTPTDVAEEMTAQNAMVTQLAPVLQSAINPSGLSATVPAPLEVGWRDAPSGRHFFVLNTSGRQVNGARIQLSGVGGATSAAVFNESRSVAVSGGGMVDDFSPFAIHIYVIP